MSQCRKFAPNIFNKSKCSNCFRQKEEHSAEALECNRASRAVARSGYLFVAPDWDFSVPLNRTKRWQRRWFVLYDDGELNYSVDEHPDTVPQGSVDMCKVLEVTGAEQVTGHPHSLALTSPDRVTFIKAASREDARWWVELLAVFPRRHKRNATFPGGRASPSLPQLGRSASPQPPRPRHLSCTGPSPRTNFITPPLKEERESPTKEESPRPTWLPEPTSTMPIEAPPLSRNDYVLSSGSPPTRDKLQCEEKSRARRDWRNERLRDIATALTDRSPETSLTLPAEGLLHLKKGWLWLKMEDGEWSKRWWVLCGPTLSAFSDQAEQRTPQVTIELSTVTGFNESSTDTRYGFQIHCSSQTLTLSAVTSGIRTNWMQALKKAVPDTPDSPITPRSLILSSDEEYRTASEGGRRGSEDWGDLPPSPPLARTAFNRVKERARARPRLHRSQSRQSTVDSVSTDDLDIAKDSAEVELRNTMNRQSSEIDDLKKQLSNAVNEVQNLESELARIRKAQSELELREKQTDEMLIIMERTERELNQRIRETDEQHSRDQKTLQHQLSDAETLARVSEEKCSLLTRDLQVKQRLVVTLEEELNRANERCARENIENERFHMKRVQALDGSRSCYKRLSSLNDLTDIDLDGDLDNLSQHDLIEMCYDLRNRFERAVLEIRTVKRELREAFKKYDDLELENVNLQGGLEVVSKEAEAHSALMASRLQDLTNKLLVAEKQARSLKSKLQDSREKRRSLSLKGRESISINKEVEDKVTELEAKIIALEKLRTRRKYKRERSSERTSPVDDRLSPGHRSLRRLRRKSLDSATASEPMKLLIRLSSLESKVTNFSNSTESLNRLTMSASETNIKQLVERDVDKRLRGSAVESIKEKLSDCIYQLALLKSGKNKRSASPSIDRLTTVENKLQEMSDILNGFLISTPEANVIDSSANSVVKQLESLLRNKLSDLAARKRLLKENGKLDRATEIAIMAEKMAYENILVGRIQESLIIPPTPEMECDRLLHKEILDTSYLISSLQAKLHNNTQKQPPTSKTSVEYLTKVLAKYLVTGASFTKPYSNNALFFNGSPVFNSLVEKQLQVNVEFNTYKVAKLPELAEALAAETVMLASDTTCCLQGLNPSTINEAWTTAQNTVNAQLIESEINHVLMRAAQVYEANSAADDCFFFSFFASERAALELWSDAVEDRLHIEMQKSIDELREYYQNSLNKLQRQNWRRRVESERIGTVSGNLLKEFADVIAHKALIDARISVLSSGNKRTNNSRDVTVPENVVVFDLLENGKLMEDVENSGLVQINQSLGAEFKCLLGSYGEECHNIINQLNLEDVVDALRKIAEEVCAIQKCTNADGYAPIIIPQQVYSWQEVCRRCYELQKRLIATRDFINNRTFQNGSRILENEEDRRPLYLGTEYLAQIENLRGAYHRTLATYMGVLQQGDLEQLQGICEHVLMAMQHWHCRTLQDVRETHTSELEILRQEKEQALAEETQATLAALDAMRKAHEAEVQREVTKFKQDFTRHQQNELLELTERLSVKCLEAAALEEQLGSATRQLAHAQQHILQLERNPQLSGMQN